MVACGRVGGTECSSVCMGSFKEIAIIFITSTVVWPRVNNFLGGSDDKASAYNVGDLGSSLTWEDLLEKEMATHSSSLAWKIPWTEEPGRLQSMGSQRVGHD